MQVLYISGSNKGISGKNGQVKTICRFVTWHEESRVEIIEGRYITRLTRRGWAADVSFARKR